MAASSIASFEDFKEEFVHCKICEEEFDDKHRVPTMLPCLHSFCLECLNQIWAGSELGLLCPICGTRCKVRTSVAGTFPLDLVSMELVHFLELKRKSQKASCKMCSSHVKSIHYCKQCEEYFCDVCVSPHQELCEESSLVAVDELLKSPSGFSQQERTCPMHKGLKLDFYCKECKCVACSSCVKMTHQQGSGHVALDLHEVYEQEREELCSLSGKLKTDSDKLNEATIILNQKATDLESQTEKKIADIEFCFKQIIADFVHRKENIIQELKDAVEEEQMQIQSRVKSARSSSKQKEDILKYCQQILSISKPSEFLSIKQSLHDKVTQYLQKPSVVSLDVGNHSFEPSNLDVLQETLKTFGAVVDKSTISQNLPFFVETFDAFVGDKAIIMSIHIADPNEDQKLLATRLSAFVSFTDTRGIVVKQILDLKEDNYSHGYNAMFTLKNEGKHCVSLRIGGHSLTNDNVCFTGLLKSDSIGALDMTLYIPTGQMDSKQMTFRAIECPFIAFSRKALNDHCCTITKEGKLVNKPSPTTHSDSTPTKKPFRGTLGSVALTGRGLRYWQVTATTVITCKLFGFFIFEACFIHHDGVRGGVTAFLITACMRHHSVCVQVIQNGDKLIHSPLRDYQHGSSADLNYGFLLDLDQQKLHIIDVKKGEVAITVRGIGVSKPLSLGFCLFNHHICNTEIEIVSGSQLHADRNLFQTLRKIV